MTDHRNPLLIPLAPALMLVLAAPAMATEGYAAGKNHCYRFTSPAGWALDGAAGKEQGIPVVFYPDKSSWSDAPAVIYTRQAEFVAGASDDKQKIQGQVDRALTRLRTANESPDSKATFVRALSGRDGTRGELWKFTGDKFGNTEMTAYFVGRGTLNFFVLSARDPAEFERALPALVALAESYREADDCKPCPDKAESCGGKAAPEH